MEAAIARGKQPGQTPVNLEEKPRGAFGQTPLLMATSASGNVEVIDVLLKHGADVSAHDDNGFTLLDIATAQGRDGVVGRLLEGGADPSAKGPDGWTPMHRAAVGHSPRYAATLEHIINSGADPNTLDEDGLPLVLYTQAVGTRQILLDAGACAPSWFQEEDGKQSCVELAECGAFPRLSGVEEAKAWEPANCDKELADLLRPPPRGLGGQRLGTACPCSCGEWEMPPICKKHLEGKKSVATEEAQRAAWKALLDAGSQLGNIATPMVMPAGLTMQTPKMIPKRGKK